MEVKFCWDPRKEAVNKRKHGVSFVEAESCFFDPSHILIADTEHSENEERMILLGMSSELRVLVVVHAEVIENEIRIISARKATRKERKQYEVI